MHSEVGLYQEWQAEIEARKWAEAERDRYREALEQIVAIDTGRGWLGEASEPIQMARDALSGPTSDLPLNDAESGGTDAA